MKKKFEHIDLTYLREFSNGNDTFIKEIISISVEQTQHEIANLKTALENDEQKRIGMICHKMRSSMGFMGINPGVMERLKQIESLPLERNEERKMYTEQIIEDCIHINEELMQVLQMG